MNNTLLILSVIVWAALVACVYSVKRGIEGEFQRNIQTTSR